MARHGAPGDILSDSVFSLNLSSAGEGPFTASMAKNMHQRCTFWGVGGSGVQDMAPPLLGNLGAKFSETSFSHFKTYFMQIDHCFLCTTI